MRIAVIGAGQVGTALGERWRALGHEVTYGVRDGKSGPLGTPSAPTRVAVEASDLVLLAVPWTAAVPLVRELGDLGGRILVDATNPILPGFQLAVGRTSSGGEALQAAATHARVVKAFNTVGFEVLRAPQFADDAAVMFVAGDDSAATTQVTALACELGFDAVALDGLVHARALEPLAALWIALSRRGEWGREFAFGLRRRIGPPSVAPREETKTTKPAATATATRPSTSATIVIYGAGNIGGNLARAWLRAGHHVRIATRDPHAPAVAALVAAGAVAIPPSGAAKDAGVVVLAVPAGACAAVVAQAGDLDGKVVIDCTNAIGRGFVLEHGLTTSVAEELQALIPRARVVKAFNQQGAETLAAPLFGHERTIGLVAGDDAPARRLAAAMVEDVGLRSIDAGPLSMARYLEPLTLAWIAASTSLRTRAIGFVALQR